MKPIFSRGSSLQIRLLIAVVVVFGLIIADSRFSPFRQVREYLDTAISPFYFIANSPRQLLDQLSQTLDSRQHLRQENQALRKELLLKNSELLLLGQYKQENARLRELLHSPLRQEEQKQITEVIATSHDPYVDQVVINHGSANGVYESQPVIDSRGVVGQVVVMAKYTSRVLLICDSTHALPVQVLRNDIRTLALGNGCTDDLMLEHLPGNADIRVGDLLVTSGLGGVYPEGYPVAIVSSVQVDHQRAWTVVKAHPTADLQRLRYLLLLWGTDKNHLAPKSAQQVHDVAEERLKHMLPHMLSQANSRKQTTETTVNPPADTSGHPDNNTGNAPLPTPGQPVPHKPAPASANPAAAHTPAASLRTPVVSSSTPAAGRSSATAPGRSSANSTSANSTPGRTTSGRLTTASPRPPVAHTEHPRDRR